MEGSTLEFYRRALQLRRELQTSEELEWHTATSPDVLHFSRPGGWQTVTNFGDMPVELPAGNLLLSSGPLDGNLLPGSTTVWLR